MEDISKKAYLFAKEKHTSQIRKDIIPKDYITHPINVASLVKEYTSDENLIAAAFLHDVLEDTDATYNDLVKLFGNKIANIVQSLTNDEKQKELYGKEKYLSKKMVNMSDDELLIKLCDRLDNVNSLGDADDIFRLKYIEETKNIVKYVESNRKLHKNHSDIINKILLKIETYS